MIRYLILILLILSCARQAYGPQPKYNRAQWRHWADSDRNCLNTRQEILKARSLRSVKMNRQGCVVVSGLWDDYYYPERHTKAKDVDIDHLIPLKHAHAHGGSQWSSSRKEIFANDPENLVITNRKYNRQKGAKGIGEWLPVHQEYACKYIRDWLKMKTKYQLQVTAEEQRAVDTSKCAISR